MVPLSGRRSRQVEENDRHGSKFGGLRRQRRLNGILILLVQCREAQQGMLIFMKDNLSTTDSNMNNRVRAYH